MAPIDVKQLHLANIANVAYGYAKILREVEILALELPYHQPFIGFEKPALGSWGA